MNAPTHIRFTQDEAEAIAAYATGRGLRKASAVRELLRLGLDTVNATSSGATNDALDVRLQHIETALVAIQREHGRQLDSILQRLRQPASSEVAAWVAREPEPGSR